MKKRLHTERLKIIVWPGDTLRDAVLATPVFTSIKLSMPGAYIAVLAHPNTTGILEGHKDIDKLIPFNEKELSGSKELRAFAKEIREQKFNVAVMLHPTQQLAQLCKSAKIKYRVGPKNLKYSKLFNRQVDVNREQSNRHECDMNLDMIEAIGAHIIRQQFHVDISDKTKSNVDKIFKEHDISEPFICLHPGQYEKQMSWSPQKFGELAKHISKKTKQPVLVLGSKDEKTLVNEVVETSNHTVIRLDGQLSEKEIAEVLKRAQVLVSNNTGLLHLTVAVGTNVVGLYPSLKQTYLERWGPYLQKESVVLPDDKAKKTEHEMDGISVDAVYKLLSKKLKK